MNTLPNKQTLKEDNEEKNYFILDKENSIVYKIHAKSSEEAMKIVLVAAYEDEKEDNDDLPEIDYHDYDNKSVIKLIKYILYTLDNGYNPIGDLQIVSQEELDDMSVEDIDSIYLVAIDSEKSRFKELNVKDYVGKNIEERTIEAVIPDWFYDKNAMKHADPEYIDEEDLGDGDVELYINDNFYNKDCAEFIKQAKQMGCSYVDADTSHIELTGTVKVLKNVIAAGESTSNYTWHTLWYFYAGHLDGELPEKIEPKDPWDWQ